MADYETVIGLEVHAQLSTKTKLFCGCPMTFGVPPNTLTCPVCLGLPGVLPVVNREAFDDALLVALALHCDIAMDTMFDRKNYYYPDLPKNYQISQNYHPLGARGYLELLSGKRVGIDNVHIEEDAGKLLHDEQTGATSVVDLNRAGTPLVEIVSAPDLRSVEEAQEYMTDLRDLLAYLDVCDCQMQEGSIRFEASVSLRPRGATALGPRVEIKNLNSFAHVRDSLAYEIRRQAESLDAGERIPRETRLWDPDAGRSERMRSKELAHDYRYFPEPDLVPIRIDDAWLARLRGRIPELRGARRARLALRYGLSAYDTEVLTESRKIADYLEAAIALGAEPKEAANIVANDLKAAANARGVDVEDLGVEPAHVAELTRLVGSGVVSKSVLKKELVPLVVAERRSPEAIVRERGLAQQQDQGALLAAVRAAVDANPKALQDVLAGKEKAGQSIVGAVMRDTKGKANPQLVRELVAQEIARRKGSAPPA